MSYNATPDLIAAPTGSMQEIGQHIIAHHVEIETWFQAQWQKVAAPFYASVDLRNSGYKIAPIDTNLFPGGFNNLNQQFTPLCIQAIRQSVERFSDRVNGILIIAENHTRNTFYLENLATLQQLVRDAGFEVRIGSMIPNMKEAMNINLESGKNLSMEPLQRHQDKIFVSDFIPELILLNNDLSSGRPDIFDGLQQTVTPALDLGWSKRLKSIHFRHYQAVAAEFAEYISIDPWFITPLFRKCEAIDFMQREGGACLEENVHILFQEIQDKYDEYGIKDQPYVVVKADSGTYGMGVMIVHSVAEIMVLNRKQRTRMSTIKEGQKVSKVIIQEGVYSHQTGHSSETVAEPVIYMIDQNVVGGFYRVHDSRDANENLNAPGMRFAPMDFDDLFADAEIYSLATDSHPKRFYSYGVISRLALLAAARESQSH